jgi:hypothetical protein
LGGGGGGWHAFRPPTATTLADPLQASGSFAFISLMELLPSALSDGRWVKTKLAVFTLGWAAMSALAVVA